MTRKLIFVCLLILLTSCIGRVPMYSPRRHNTKEHREAKENSVCLECHDTKMGKTGHSKTEDCMRCHRLCQGC